MWTLIFITIFALIIIPVIIWVEDDFKKNPIKNHNDISEVVSGEEIEFEYADIKFHGICIKNYPSDEKINVKCPIANGYREHTINYSEIKLIIPIK